MNKPPEISNLAKVIEKYLKGRQLVFYSSEYLTKPGDNYGSIMLSIVAKLKNSNGVKEPFEELSLVAKLPPLTSEQLWKLFKPEVTSLRENAIYVDLAPSFRQLQLDSGIPENEFENLFAKFYGCRISLDENATTLDRDAVLVLENLQCSGYKAGKRKNMFDLEHIRFVLKYAAKYHAYTIALRNKQPEKFEEDILPKFTPYGFTEEVRFEIDQMTEDVKMALGDDINAIKRYEKIHKIFDDYNSKRTYPPPAEIEPFTTIAHCDLWINNIMIHYDHSGSPEKLKIIDFQTTQYESLAHDLILLLFTSVKTDILDKNLDNLLKHYYEEFINCLTKMLCDVEGYSYDKFFQEVKRITPVQIPHAIYMSKVIMVEDTNLSDEMDIEALHSSASPELLIKIRDILRLSEKFGLF